MHIHINVQPKKDEAETHPVLRESTPSASCIPVWLWYQHWLSETAQQGMQQVLRLGLWGNKLRMVACTCSRNLHRLSFPQVKVQGSHLEVRSLRAELMASHKTWELRTAGVGLGGVALGASGCLGVAGLGASGCLGIAGSGAGAPGMEGIKSLSAFFSAKHRTRKYPGWYSPANQIFGIGHAASRSRQTKGSWKLEQLVSPNPFESTSPENASQPTHVPLRLWQVGVQDLLLWPPHIHWT